VSKYLGIAASDKKLFTEKKFDQIAEMTRDVARLSIGYDRSRPFNVNERVFYLQKCTPEELKQLQEAGLL
jgi:hypothetical protein